MSSPKRCDAKLPGVVISPGEVPIYCSKRTGHWFGHRVRVGYFSVGFAVRTVIRWKAEPVW